MSYEVERDGRFARAEALLEEYFGRVDSGEPLTFEAWTSQHAEIAGELRQLHSMCVTLRSREDALERRRREGSDAAGASWPDRGDDLQFHGLNRFGDYEIDPSPLAEGGMGTILSVRDRALRRGLAMKVLRVPESVADRRLVARFLDEARITSQLDHPGIVPVHEIGLDAAGRPYFTMKRVQGQTFERVLERVAAREPEWTQARALGVLQRVCEAVAFAHQRGVIHRDLKPSNVMVGEFGEVFVMDWGLARVLEGDGAAASAEIESTRHGAGGSDEADSKLSTQHGDVLGTPAYMAPEQAMGRQDQVGRHSDAYAIGAMLYHLLARRPPYSDERGMPPPRVVLSRVLAGPPESLRREARDAPAELVAICERAMEREIARRYPDVPTLSADLSAFLEGRVVRAYETGAWAEARKWVRRNRALAAALAAGVLILVGGVLTSVNYAVEARYAAELADRKTSEAKASAKLAQLAAARADSAARSADEERLAAEAARKAEMRRADELAQVTEFQLSMFGDIDIHLMGLRLREDILNAARTSMERSVCTEAEIAERTQSLEALLAGANLTDAAVASLERNVLQRALGSIDEQFSEQPGVQAKLLGAVGIAFWSLGRYAPAEVALTRSLTLTGQNLGVEDPATIRAMCRLADVLTKQGKLETAESMACSALDRSRQYFGEQHPNTLDAAQKLASVFLQQARMEEAELLLRDSYEQSALASAVDARSAIANLLGLLLTRRGKFDEAQTLFEEAIELSSRSRGRDSGATLAVVANLALVHQEQGRTSEAEQALREVLEFRRGTHGNHHPETLKIAGSLGSVLGGQGKWNEAEPLLRESWDYTRMVFGDDHHDALVLANNYCKLLEHQGRYHEEESLLRNVLEKCRSALGASHWVTLLTSNNLCTAVRHLGRWSESEPLLRDTWERSRVAQGDDHPYTQLYAGHLALVLHLLGRNDEAEVLYSDTLERMRRVLGESHAHTLGLMTNLASLLQATGRFDGAEALFRQAFEGRRRILGDDHLDTILSEARVAELMQVRGQVNEAGPVFVEALSGVRRILGDDHPETILLSSRYGTLLADQDRLIESEDLLRDSLDRGLRVFGVTHLNTTHIATDLGLVLQQAGKLDEAEQHLGRSLELRRSALGSEHPLTIASENNLGLVLRELGNLNAAEPLLRHAMEVSRCIHGEDHPASTTIRANLASALEDMGRLDDAEFLYRDSLERLRRALGDDHRDTLMVMASHGRVLLELGQAVEAEVVLREAVEGCGRSFGTRHRNTLQVSNHLAQVLMMQDKLDEAEPILRETLETCREILGELHPITMSQVNVLAGLLHQRGDSSAAVELLARTLQLADGTAMSDDDSLVVVTGNLAFVLLATKDAAGAKLRFQEMLERSGRLRGDHHSSTLYAMAGLGAAQLELGELAAAERTLLDCESACLAVGDQVLRQLRSSRSLLARLHDLLEVQSPGHGHSAMAANFRTLAGEQPRQNR